MYYEVNDALVSELVCDGKSERQSRVLIDVTTAMWLT